MTIPVAKIEIEQPSGEKGPGIDPDPRLVAQRLDQVRGVEQLLRAGEPGVVIIALGRALREALGDKVGIRRFGDATVPLDEALVQAVVDVAGRPYVVHTGEPEGQEYVVIGGNYVGSLTRHVLESFAYHAGIALHVRVLSGRDPHHIVEAQFKALARALRFAVALDPRVEGIPSTKGAL